MNDVEYLQPCSHEEADTHILFHVAHCARQGLRKVVIRTVLGTDVVALAMEHFPAFRLDELWVSCGVCTHFRQIAIHEIVKNDNEKAMVFLHAINGCDTVSSLLGCGKKSAWLGSIRNTCLPRSISAACRRELWDPIEDRKVHRCHMQQNVFSQWSKRGKERVVRTRFSDNIEHPTNIAAICATRGIPRSPSCLVVHFGGGSNLIRVETLLNWTTRGVHCMLRTFRGDRG